MHSDHSPYKKAPPREPRSLLSYFLEANGQDYFEPRMDYDKWGRPLTSDYYGLNPRDL